MEVEDTGCGIADTLKDKLFVTFSRGDFQRNKYRGLGLGLANVAKLCDSLHGFCGFESRVGVGSLFWCAIPVRVDKNPIRLNEEFGSNGAFIYNQRGTNALFASNSGPTCLSKDVSRIFDEVVVKCRSSFSSVIPSPRIAFQSPLVLEASSCLRILLFEPNLLLANQQVDLLCVFPRISIYVCNEVFDETTFASCMSFIRCESVRRPDCLKVAKKHMLDVNEYAIDILIMDLSAFSLANAPLAAQTQHLSKRFPFAVSTMPNDAMVPDDLRSTDLNSAIKGKRFLPKSKISDQSIAIFNGALHSARLIQRNWKVPVLILCPVSVGKVGVLNDVTVVAKPSRDDFFYTALQHCINSRNTINTNTESIPEPFCAAPEINIFGPPPVPNEPTLESKPLLVNKQELAPLHLLPLPTTLLSARKSTNSSESRVSSVRQQTMQLLDPSVDLNKIRILMAEDHPLNQKMIRKQLELMGFLNVHIVSDGDEAVDKLRLNPDEYDLCLFDIQMSRMDGDIAARIIRNELNLVIPIIALTACPADEVKSRLHAAGIVHILSKPLSVQLLVPILNLLLVKNPYDSTPVLN